MRDDAARGLLLVAGATFFWSLSGVFARWLPQVDPWTFNATRGLGMGVALLLWMAWEYRLGAIRLFTEADPAALAISGSFFAVGSSLYMRGARHVPAVQMVLVTMADTVLNPLWVWLVHREVPAVSVFWGGGVILLAITVTAWPQRRASRRGPVH